MSQPAPEPGQQNVGEAVIRDMEARIALGKERYGTALQTFNGRDALIDAYEEVLDLAMYLKQRLMELETLREWVLTSPRSTNTNNTDR